MSLTLKEIKKMLKAWHFYKASSLISESGANLKKTVSLIEGAVEALPAQNREAVKLHYYERVPIESIAAIQHVCWQAIYKRIDTGVDLIFKILRELGG